MTREDLEEISTKVSDIYKEKERQSLSDIPISERISEAKRKANEHNTSLRRDNDRKRDRNNKEK